MRRASAAAAVAVALLRERARDASWFAQVWPESSADFARAVFEMRLDASAYLLAADAAMAAASGRERYELGACLPSLCDAVAQADDALSRSLAVLRRCGADASREIRACLAPDCRDQWFLP